MSEIKIRRALISVSDKTGLLKLVNMLQALEIRIISTGGTSQLLRDNGIPVTDVSTITGFPEIMGGRVKTLHPLIHGGILAKRDVKNHRMAMEAHGIDPIDLVIVNLYPFADTVAKGASFDDTIEQIDIGGPSLIRGAAKNHPFVTTITAPSQYQELMDALDNSDGETTLALRRKWAAEAFSHCAEYDALIANWFLNENLKQTISDSTQTDLKSEDELPVSLNLSTEKVHVLRYGENPHQSAGIYKVISKTWPYIGIVDSKLQSLTADYGIANATLLQGKALSYNNYVDADAAFEMVNSFAEPAVVIVKHTNPCGLAMGVDILSAWKKALAADPVSAFGGVVALNGRVNADLAKELIKLFLEVIIAPEIEDEALTILNDKPNLRFLQAKSPKQTMPSEWTCRSISGGGLLVQARDGYTSNPEDLKIVTKLAPSEQEFKDLIFAWKVCKYVKSNAIVLANDQVTLGIGAGQMSRVEAARLAVSKAETLHNGVMGEKGGVAASDAFFPFADGLETLAKAGIRSIIQPGGALRDQEVIDMANQLGLSMVFTGIRHFRH